MLDSWSGKEYAAAVIGGLSSVTGTLKKVKDVPQRLKPQCEQNVYGTAEAVPLSEIDFSIPSSRSE